MMFSTCTRIVSLSGMALASSILIATLASPVHAQASSIGGASSSLVGLDYIGRVEGSYIVVLRDESVHTFMSERLISDPELAAQSISEDFQRHFGGMITFTYGTVFKGFAVSGIDEATAKAISEDPNVSYVEADVLLQGTTVQTPATWGIDRIDQRYLPLSNSYNYTNTGTGVRAYVIDSGVKAHNEFLTTAGKNRLLPTGFTTISDGLGTSDCNGHGTHVAATIGGVTYGVAKGVSIVPVRVLDCSASGAASQVEAGLNWVAANAVKPAVVNFSIGPPGREILSSMQTAISGVVAAGIPISVAAGNNSDNACYYSGPALAPTTAVISVGNSSSADARNTLSNWGSCVTLFAPGTNITSAGIASVSATTVMSGTSMAAPHVAGTIALYLQSYPTASPTTVKSAIVSASTRGVISGTASSPNRLLYTDLSSSGGSDPALPAIPSAPTEPYALCINAGGLFELGWAASSGDVGNYELWRVSTFQGYTTNTSVTVGVWGASTGWKVRACNGAGCSGFTAIVINWSPGSMCE